MANSIKPDFLDASNLLRMDAGFDWFHNFTWTSGDVSAPVSVNLNNWTITSEFLDSCDEIVFDSSVAVVDEIDPANGQFEVRVSSEASSALEFSDAGFKNLDIIVTATNDIDDLGYTPGMEVKLIAGSIVAYAAESII